jgi:hypothetical protein
MSEQPGLPPMRSILHLSKYLGNLHIYFCVISELTNFWNIAKSKGKSFPCLLSPGFHRNTNCEHGCIKQAISHHYRKICQDFSGSILSSGPISFRTFPQVLKTSLGIVNSENCDYFFLYQFIIYIHRTIRSYATNVFENSLLKETKLNNSLNTNNGMGSYPMIYAKIKFKSKNNLGYNAVYSGIILPMCRRNVLYPSSELKCKWREKSKIRFSLRSSFTLKCRSIVIFLFVTLWEPQI